jgi:hypothetical protein
MTAGITGEAPEYVDRDALAGALRTVAACWEGPRNEEWPPRQAAAYVTEYLIRDQPKRGSEWLEDGQPGLTPDQARRAVFGYIARAAPGEGPRAWAMVIDALEGRLQPPVAPDNELSCVPGTPLCAWCHRPIPAERGPLARYCRDSHRVSHHRARKREKLTGRPPGRQPR